MVYTGERGKVMESLDRSWDVTAESFQVMEGLERSLKVTGG